ncbi:hypothetical protein LUZ63_010701 [Rhynchospora breviuscula]|uniref:Protein NRT1/ PTR FAMILY 5.2-like n=1 Tax=Rhynchospora breviuscula TaxID=2022672 RepID=A0A9Q0HQA6_9POAL|nr:hypothetical protein LUZ63_010701 [Rhynchospora breviuscula]
MAELSLESVQKDYTRDGTVDLKGNPVLRSKRGGWTACSFLVVYEVFERIAFNGIASNLVRYLTRELHQGTVTSANNVTNWVGTMWLSPIIGAYVADAYLGRYWTFMIGSIIYILGMLLLTLAVSVPSLKPPACKNNTNAGTYFNCKEASQLQLGIFFLSLYILAIGNGGCKANISTIGADQFDAFDQKERVQKHSFFNWWLFSVFFGNLMAATVLVYIQDNVGWAVGYALCTVGLMFAVIIFVIGTPFYRHKLQAGSPFTKMAKVLVAALRKRTVPLPSDTKELYELSLIAQVETKQFQIKATDTLRCLNKASVKIAGKNSPWELCTVTQVEETKQMLKMLPILVSTFVPSMMLAQVNTLFVKQGMTLNRHIGAHFQIPPASLQAFGIISMLICIVIYDQLGVPFLRKFTKIPRGISILQRIGIGQVLYIVTAAVAAMTEHHRLRVAREHGVVGTGATVPLTIFILLPQFVIMGIADAFMDPARFEFFYDQAPEGMKSLGTSYNFTSLGIGNFLSSLLLSIVSHLTKRNGGKGWILNNLNESRLDYFYTFFMALNCLNFVFLIVVSKNFVYNAVASDSETETGD